MTARRPLMLLALLVVALSAATASANPPLSIDFGNRAASGHAFAISTYGEPAGPCWVAGQLAGTPDPVPSPGSEVIRTGTSAPCSVLPTQATRLFWVTSQDGQPVYKPVTWAGNPQGVINLSWGRGTFNASGLPSPGTPLQVASNELLCMQYSQGPGQKIAIGLQSQTCGTTTVTVTITGTGSLASTPPGISCATGCQQVFQVPIGSSWTLIAQGSVQSGSSFTDWGPQGACTGTDDDCTFTANGPLQVVANFGPPPTYTLAVNETGTGKGTVISSPALFNCTNGSGVCSGQFSPNSVVQLVAIPEPGSVFAGFTGPCGVYPGYRISCWADVTGNGTVGVVFNSARPPTPPTPPTPPAPPTPPGPTPTPPGPGPTPTPAPVPSPTPSVSPVVGPNPPGPIPTTNPGIRPSLTDLGITRAKVGPHTRSDMVYRLNMNARVQLVFTDLGDTNHRYAYRFQPGRAGGDSGLNRVAIRTRINTRPVLTGRWRVQVSAANAAGRTSTQTRVLTIR